MTETRRGPRVGRRTFLKLMGGAAGAAVAVGGSSLWLPVRRTAAALSLTPFLDPLPIPPVITPSGTLNGQPFFNVTMQTFTQQLHSQLPAQTPVWGYNGLYPGPTFETRRGKPIHVKWKNNLPATHLFHDAVDVTLHGDEKPQNPEVRTVVHLHGAKVEPDSDGYPEAWFTKNFAKKGPLWENEIYHYPNDQQATELWYHDHGLGTTRLNIIAGLAGFYFIRDDHEDSLNLPKGAYEIPLLIQDRAFYDDGSLLYPVQADPPPDNEIPPVWIPEFFGDTVLVNGKVWPYLEVEPRKYRFRLLNGSNARWYHLTLIEADSNGNPNVPTVPGPDFNIIGTDGGFRASPAKATEILISPAERYDIVVDFSGVKDKFFLLSNDANSPFPDGDPVTLVGGDKVMLFKVKHSVSGTDRSSLPHNLGPGNQLDAKDVKIRDLILSELESSSDEPVIGRIDARGTLPTTDDPWTMPVTEKPMAGSVEIWRIINTTGDAHPIHIHLVQFQVLDRQPFDPNLIDTTVSPPQVTNSNLQFTGPRVQPKNENTRPYLQYEQNAFKDTVKTFPGEVTRVIMRFDLPTGTPITTGEKFRYVLHCHILEHEDNDMMRPYDVVG